ncbi:cupredoxin domain-containing protein [Loigolactobacillus coryniformis]|jgi:plastocyanin domain-containing protein|uniref:cupredoxin domain-containing protein n=1 Tax=Lactobacillaceae TaxID=33958 RepID=UPI000CFAEDD5|nr:MULTISPECIES: cupredoxin domain-containing protein [Lactobacillaceae]AVK64665.1 copper-binding protein [Lactobacillus sp. CBA3606]MBW4801826.1 cupredoxin domain-containing protein [Loigolactobacillus coryniformis subsp. torquens]MBW4804527.1 cupredoxin domain-containing protein [Loigolactobacillus coryniformis subsp. torquens]
MAEKKQSIVVVVDGGYHPDTVKLTKGIPAEIIFKRISDKGCVDTIVFPKFGIKRFLPINEQQIFSINTDKAGEYQFHCGMDMVYGKVVIK